MKIKKIKEHAIVLPLKQLAQIKGGDDNSGTSSSIIIVDMDQI